MSDELNAAVDLSSSAQKTLDFWESLLAVSTLMGACASIMSQDMRSFRGFLRCTTLGLGASYLAGSALENSGISLGYIHCVVGLAALYANYVFIFIMKLVELVATNPRGFIDDILDRLIGRSKN